jgi:hypothetical protein
LEVYIVGVRENHHVLPNAAVTVCHRSYHHHRQRQNVFFIIAKADELVCPDFNIVY